MKYLLILSLFINGFAAETDRKADHIGEGIDPSEEKFFYRELMSSISMPPIRIPPIVPPIRIPPVQPPIRRPPVQPPIRIPPVSPPIRIPPVSPPIRLPPVQPPIRIPPVQPPIRLPPVQPPIRLPPVQPPIRVPPVAPPIRVPPTSPPILRIPPTRSPVLRIPPTSPPFLRIPPTSPPILRVPPVSPPILRVPPVSPPSLRVPPVTPPSLRVPPVSPPSLRVPPVTPPSLRVPPVTPPSLRVPPVSPPILRIPPAALVPIVAPPNLRVPPVAPQRVPPIPPVNQPALRVPPTQEGQVGTIGRSMCRCGGQVNPGIQNCDPFLWQPTTDPLMHCFAHGGPNDPCALNIMNDNNSGLNKDPIGCYNANGLGRQNRRYVRFDTFFLWDEPDTYGKSYTWAGQEWSAYANRFGRSIQLMRQSGIRFASPLFSSGLPGILAQHVNEFFRACGPSCSDPNSPAYIDIIAVNAVCRPSDTVNPENPRQGCRNAANYFVDETNSLMQSGRLAVYITNWSRLNAKNAYDQLAAMEVTDTFFRSGSRIQRVYWFGAIDNGIGTETSFLTQQIGSGSRAGQTLGQVWRQECNCS